MRLSQIQSKKNAIRGSVSTNDKRVGMSLVHMVVVVFVESSFPLPVALNTTLYHLQVIALRHDVN